MFPKDSNEDLSSEPTSVSDCCNLGGWLDLDLKSGQDLGRSGCLDQSRSPLSVQIVPLDQDQSRQNSGLVRLGQEERTRYTSFGAPKDGLMSWGLPPTPTSYDSGDSVDSFSITTSSTSSKSMTSSSMTTTFSLPPTPPATPPNNWSQNSPASSPVPSPKSGVAVGRFQCDACPKVFGDRAHLAEHRRYRHSDDRPHGCPECLKGFKSRSNLNQHIRTTHQKKKFDCTVSHSRQIVLVT